MVLGTCTIMPSIHKTCLKKLKVHLPHVSVKGLNLEGRLIHCITVDI